MIIFNKEKYEGIATEDNAGIVGENLVSKVEFTVNDFVGKNTIAAIHLRFSTILILSRQAKVKRFCQRYRSRSKHRTAIRQ